MPTALEVHASTKEFLEGKDPGVPYRAGPKDRTPSGNLYRLRYSLENIVGNSSGGSQNYGPMAGSNDLLYHYYRKEWGEVEEILDAWEEYSKLNYLTAEVFCCNIYIAFITTGVLVAAQVAHKVGRHNLCTALLNHARTGAVLSALSSGWRKNDGGFKGYPVMMCGSRSFSGNIRYELTGNTFASQALDYWTGMAEPPVGSMEQHIQTFAGNKNIWHATDLERATLKAIIRGDMNMEDLHNCIAWLEEGPGFSADAAIIRTTEMVGFFLLGNSINTGSTSYMPGKAWYANGAPRPRWGQDAHYGIWTVDYPRRVWGGQLKGELTANGYRVQREKVHRKRIGDYPPHSWFDERRPEGQNNVDGWLEMPFKGDIELDLRVGKSGIKLAYPGGGPPPPPPPNGGGWHTIHADSYLKFTDSAAAAALATINGGSNHFEVSQVACEPSELAKVQRELTKIVGD